MKTQTMTTKRARFGARHWRIAALTALCALALLGLTGARAIAADFPYNATYQSGIGSLASDQNDANSRIASRWSDWKVSWVTYSGAGGGRRVLFDGDGNGPGDTNAPTVSEGIGYGMLFAVYFGDQSLFDDLYRYAKLHFNSFGVMGWKIKADGSPDTNVGGQNNATDGDEDIAASLCFAWKNGGSSNNYNYHDEAATLINNIKAANITSNFVVNAGNWDTNFPTTFDPSYFAPAWYRIFADITGDYSWYNVIDKGYSLIYACRNTNTGLIPQNIAVDSSGNFSYIIGNQYQYDAVRMPWRLGVDYNWTYESDSHHWDAYYLVTSIADYYGGVINTDHSQLDSPNVKATRNIDGTLYGDYESGSFVGMAGVAQFVKGENYNNGPYLFNALLYSSGRANDAHQYYFDGALHLFSALYMTGNFPKLY